MEDSRYKTERQSPRSKSKIGLAELLGTFEGAGAGCVSGFLYGFAKDIVLNELPYLLKGRDLGFALNTAFSSGIVYAGDLALIGGGLGLLLTRKLKDMIGYVLRGK